jgi:hypothetical protein
MSAAGPAAACFSRQSPTRTRIADHRKDSIHHSAATTAAAPKIKSKTSARLDLWTRRGANLWSLFATPLHLGQEGSGFVHRIHDQEGKPVGPSSSSFLLLPIQLRRNSHQRMALLGFRERSHRGAPLHLRRVAGTLCTPLCHPPASATRSKRPHL